MTVRDFVDVSPGEDVWVPPKSYVLMRYKRADRSDDFVAVARQSVSPRQNASVKLTLSMIQVEPAWVCTFHKLQGLTYREEDDVGLALCLAGCKKAGKSAFHGFGRFLSCRQPHHVAISTL